MLFIEVPLSEVYLFSLCTYVAATGSFIHYTSPLSLIQSYLVCPYCYNEPPFKAVGKGMSCSVCPHESCPQAKPQHRVERCSECDNGVLVLEPHWQTGGTPKWKISCNNNKYRMIIIINVHNYYVHIAVYYILHALYCMHYTACMCVPLHTYS